MFDTKTPTPAQTHTGESTGNREGVLQGQADYPLTDTGREQAAAAGRRLRAEAEGK